MPNWVFNTLYVSGNNADLTAFREEMAKPFITKYYSFETNEEMEQTSNSPFSFWNILRPEDSILDEYWGRAIFGEMGANNWYNWNVANWGCKWDANDVEIVNQDDDSILYQFSTPWSPVRDLFVKHLFPRFPNLTFSYEYEEEQGWGGELSYANGQVVSESEYDIPTSHADYYDQDKEGSCVCQIYDDPSNWYADCPTDNLDEWQAEVLQSATQNEGE